MRVTILELATEVLYKIVDFVDPEDVITFSMTCKASRELFLPKIFKLFCFTSIDKETETFRTFIHNFTRWVFFQLVVGVSEACRVPAVITKVLSTTGQELKGVDIALAYKGTNSRITDPSLALLIARSISDGLSGKNSLTQFWISNLELSEEAVACVVDGFSESSISELYIVNCGISAKLLQKYFESVKSENITTVSLSGNPLGKGISDFCVALHDKSMLHTLDLSSTQLLDAEVAAIGGFISSNGTVKVLNLSNNSISASGCQSLQTCLSKNTTLQSLALNFTRIGDNVEQILKGLELNENSALTAIFLNGTGITNIGAEKIAVFLKTTNRIQILGLQLNTKISSVGILAISSSLKTNITLESLDLEGITIDEKVLETLCSSLISNVNLQKLSLKSVGGLTTPGLSQISKLLSSNIFIKFLELSSQTIPTESIIEFCESLRINKGLQKLGLSRVGLTYHNAHQILRAVEENPESKLWHLDLKYNNIREDEMTLLSTFSKKIDVELRETKIYPKNLMGYAEKMDYYSKLWYTQNVDFQSGWLDEATITIPIVHPYSLLIDIAN